MNPTQSFTLYQVEALLQNPNHVAQLPPVPVLGQMAGGQAEHEDPIEVGQLVFVGFLEGDENRPAIVGTYPSHETQVAQTIAEAPRTRIRRRGVQLDVDKDGNSEVRLAKSKSGVLADDTGTPLVEARYNGSGYDLYLYGDSVNLGGDTGLKALMMENMISVFNNHVHTGVTTGAGSSGTPAAPLVVGTHSTTVTKAK